MQTENQNFFTFQIIVYIGKVKLNKNVFLCNKIMVNINIFIKSDNKFRALRNIINLRNLLFKNSKIY